ncbi:MAG: pyridoxal phosphate-dependent aminotransferase [Muribaculaceae bacterium]|nr:pyridoxal phosphate-dependent aminotransferase [Muribaculaceae bacterium]
MRNTYDFDEVIDRHGTGAMKYESLDLMFGRHDVTPLWIADLDFAVCPDIMSALRRRLDHPVLGYSAAPESYWQSIVDWLHKRHGVKVNREELTFVPGVVKGIALAINYFTCRGDKVVIQPPVYHPFKMVIEGNQRVALPNPLKFDGENYTMDLDGLQDIIDREHPKMLVLCNPHNPIGIQWDDITLRRLASMCRKAGMIVISDEIHGDLMLSGRRHVAFATVSDDAAAVAVTLGAPSKTFNIPGLVSSWMFVKNPELREPYYSWLEANEFNAPTMTACIGAEAAYTHGEEWLEQMLSYVEANIDYACDYVASSIPGVNAIRPQASFLLWLDFRGLGMGQKELMDMLLDKAHIALNDGTMFGVEGTGFMRLNVGTPRKVLADALEHIRIACAAVAGIEA